MTGTTVVPVIYREGKRRRKSEVKRGGMRHGSTRKRLATMPQPIRNKLV